MSPTKLQVHAFFSKQLKLANIFNFKNSLRQALFSDHPRTMANFTGEGNYTSKLNQALSAPPAGIAEFLRGDAVNV